jgi:hypothetical protein
MLWSGLFQSWDTFAPAPKASNTRLEGVVIARDGDLCRFHFPQMEELSLFDRYVKERYRKFAETLPVESNSEAWLDVAQHLARSYGDPANPTEVVMLVKYSSDIDLNGQRRAPHADVFFQKKFVGASE